MIVIAEETSDLRRCEFSSQLRLLIPAFSLPNAPAGFTADLHSSWKYSPTTHRDESRRIHNFGTMLSPVTSSAHLALSPKGHRSVSYYALFKGWLLLSQPPTCLRQNTSFHT